MPKKELNIVTVDNWDFGAFGDDDERRVRDLNLGARLQQKPPINIRRIIRTHWAALEKLGEIVVVSLGEKTQGGRPGEEYWLNKDQSLYVAMHCGTKVAADVSVALIQAHNKLRIAVVNQQKTIAELYEKLGAGTKLLPYVTEEPVDRSNVWDWDLAEELARLYDLPPPERRKGYPVFMAGFIGWLHDLFPEPIIKAIRERAQQSGAKRYQFMTDLTMEDLRQIQTMLRVVLMSNENDNVKEVKQKLLHVVATESARRMEFHVALPTLCR